MMKRPDLDDLIRRSVETVRTMDPIDRGLMFAAQQRSFARGNVGLSNPDVTTEVVRRAYDQMHPGEVAFRELLRNLVGVIDEPDRSPVTYNQALGRARRALEEDDRG